ncbi:hypothetical protein H6F78_12950 [Coleofasciculus sp. FACHB-64]|uniref:hypothetical protein n=1 Tax=Cyanophyceae TaxID=3028117 RepID=UPI0016892910|nr:MULTISPECIES: hypothetical protein [unclassified Coleofasciculus]MBD1840210.1 hypothetical protein [Coleofasciculus sp. FACHB-501]MBD2046490.1 hypothetical protein [Coleofasciculus sp. FACHB-64]
MPEPLTAAAVTASFVHGAAKAAGAAVATAVVVEAVKAVKESAQGGASAKGATA